MTEPTYRWVARLPARTLRELAALAPPDRREFVDPAAAADELAAMLAQRTRPTLGWYRRHLAATAPTPDHISPAGISMAQVHALVSKGAELPTTPTDRPGPSAGSVYLRADEVAATVADPLHTPGVGTIER